MLLEIFYLAVLLKPFLVARATDSICDIMTGLDDDFDNVTDRFKIRLAN